MTFKFRRLQGFGVRLVASAAALAVTAYAIGLLVFTETLARTTPDTLPEVDAVVVLTGAPGRISAAFELLEGGAGERLLISGVDPKVADDALPAYLDASSPKFACCVDLGREATTTISNAVETSGWAEEKGYERLIVVTSSYHLPRALLELRRAMPEKTLIGYPTFQKGVPLDNWWLYPGTTKLLVGEYTKYLVALTHLHVA